MHVIHFENIKSCMHEMSLALNVLIMKRLHGAFFPPFLWLLNYKLPWSKHVWRTYTQRLDEVNAVISSWGLSSTSLFLFDIKGKLSETPSLQINPILCSLSFSSAQLQDEGIYYKGYNPLYSFVYFSSSQLKEQKEWVTL